MNTKNTKNNGKLATAALAGLLTVGLMTAQSSFAGHGEKHACAGKNGCGGQEEKAKSGCKTADGKEKHACKGMNSCAGNGADGKNYCKGHGSCATDDSKK